MKIDILDNITGFGKKIGQQAGCYFGLFADLLHYLLDFGPQQLTRIWIGFILSSQSSAWSVW